MASKELKFGDDARARLKAGIDVLADTLKSTLGPRGRNVIVDKKFGPPQVNSDGVKRRRTRPADFGLPEGRRDHLVTDSVEHSAEIIRRIFTGEGGGHNAPVSPETSRRNVVVLNSAAALMAAGKATAFQEASAIAQDSIDSGAAQARLSALVKVSQEQT